MTLINAGHNRYADTLKIIFKEIDHNQRIFTTKQMKELIVFLNKSYFMKMNHDFYPLYKYHISTLLPKTDIDTFVHFMKFLKIYEIKLNKAEHEKLCKVAFKRISRIMDIEKHNENTANKLTPYLALFKMMECLGIFTASTDSSFLVL